MAESLKLSSWAPAPLRGILLGGTVPLFFGVLLSDFTYSSTYEIQWKNFASRLLVGGLVFCGLSLLWTFVNLIRGDRSRRMTVGFFALLATWILGFIDALVHAKDAWASMPGGLVMSVMTAVLACLATWFGFATPRIRGLR